MCYVCIVVDNNIRGIGHQLRDLWAIAYLFSYSGGMSWRWPSVTWHTSHQL